MEKLESAELLTTKPSAGMSAEDEAKNEGFIAAFTNRIVDNLQISVQNVHIRYEDDVSVPGHPFSVGLTLGGFSATSTDKDWQPTFIHNSKEGVHKLAQLDSLSIYFDTDSESLAGMPSEKAIVEFNKRIAKAGPEATHVKHQFVMRPVSGEGRFTINHHPNDHVPKTDAELLFKELAFTIDEDQYRDALSMLDLFHFYTRKNQYRKYRPEPKLIEQNKNRALLQFAQNAILAEVKERHRRWTWEYFRQRRDDRKLYIYVFKLDARGEIQPNDKVQLDELERKLSYQDIRFYRSIARSELRKEKVNAQRTAQQKKLQGGATAGKAGGGGWLGWVWGGSGNKGEAQPSEEQPQDILTDDQRKELYDTIDFDESQAVTGGLDLPKDTMKLRAKAKLDTGSFTLLKDPHGSKHEMIKIVFDDFAANAVQRPDNLEAVLALGAMSVFDGTKEDSLHKQIVKVKQTPSDANGGGGGYLIDPNQREASSDALEISEKDVAGETSIDPFFFVKFEQNPLDGSADTALTVKLRYMEIIYHKGYVEEIVRFFKPPASQLESVNALVDAASSTLEGIRKETRAGLEFALQQHKTVDLRVDMNAWVQFLAIVLSDGLTCPTPPDLSLSCPRTSRKRDVSTSSSMQAISLSRANLWTKPTSKTSGPSKRSSTAKQTLNASSRSCTTGTISSWKPRNYSWQIRSKIVWKRSTPKAVLRCIFSRGSTLRSRRKPASWQQHPISLASGFWVTYQIYTSISAIANTRT